ncbi:DUF3999 family protein [Aggregatimonas sangjinii]|nr:DUF3999 family protein [Aggregatimonas sangjinii]
MKNKLLFFLGFLFCAVSFAQLDTYAHKMALSGIQDQWHKVQLPDVLFGEVAQEMNDLRIYGVVDSDTIEAPYLLHIASGEKFRKRVDFELLNVASNAKGHYFTYKVNTLEDLNQIKLDIANENYDWKVVLEGSQNQDEWFTILNDYRIVAIKNAQTDYSFSELNFSNSAYRYYRLLIKNAEKPNIRAAKISVDDEINAKYREYTATYTSIHEEDKQTILDIDFKRRLPISMLRIDVQNDVDYYRPVVISYLADSTQTEKGWRYGYRNLSSGTLSSIEDNTFSFKSTLTQKLRVTVQNHDNEPLNIEGASAKGYVHELLVRFTKPASYYLAFGKANATKPQYDIAQAGSQIPTNLSSLSLGDMQDIPKKGTKLVSPLFENKFWLWAVMAIVILMLAGITLRMIQKK